MTTGQAARAFVSLEALKRALDLAIRVALGDVAPLVAYVLAARECELDLGAAVLEVEPRRHERQPALLDLPGQRCDFLAMQEQLAVALGLVVLDVPGAVF